MLVMLCTRCQQREARVTTAENRAKFEAELGAPWPFPEGLCQQCWREWVKTPEGREQLKLLQNVLWERWRKKLERLEQNARLAALKALDVADAIAGRI